MCFFGKDLVTKTSAIKWEAKELKWKVLANPSIDTQTRLAMADIF